MGENYPDITMLPVVAGYFGVTADDLLGIDRFKREEKITEYLEFYDKMRFRDSASTFSNLSSSVKEFPGEFRLLVRYMELLICEKTGRDDPDYEKASSEVMSIYDSIQKQCTDDGIRMWAKRLVCQHLHSKAFVTGENCYQEKAMEILCEMPEMINSRDYLSTMLTFDKAEHFSACSGAIEQLVYMLQNVTNHYCYYDDSFSAEYKIQAINKMLSVFEIFFTDGEYGKLWHHVIYNYGHLGRFYYELGDIDNAMKCFNTCANYAYKYDSSPRALKRSAQFFEGRIYEKTLRGKTMCERMKILFTERYPLSSEFKGTSEFKTIIDKLEGNS